MRKAILHFADGREEWTPASDEVLEERRGYSDVDLENGTQNLIIFRLRPGAQPLHYDEERSGEKFVGLTE